MKKQIILSFAVLIISNLAFGQTAGESKWQEHLAYLDKKYPALPSEKLDSITASLDSTAIAEQCFKFIPNPENTKFVAFYLTDRNSSSFNSIHREYGGTYRNYKFSDKKGTQLELFAYCVTGMYYEDKWYYHVDEYVEFYADNSDQGKNIFLIRTLNDKHFFAKNKVKENKGFWDKGEFEKNAYIFKKEYPNIPYVVVAARLNKKNRENSNLNKKIEQAACTISSDLWEQLHKTEPEKYHRRYKGKYMESYCLSLYNPERNLVLLPIIYYDSGDKASVKYYVAKISTTGKTIYTWKKFPEKKINRNPNDESLEVIYDIRNFIPNWGWGTNNMISDAKFWSSNFTENDLEILGNQ